jgi:putative component of membrane protein insertase Oxa1/YidC/SpoIIIJ protein YidD
MNHFFLLLISSLFAFGWCAGEEPWGTDATLAKSTVKKPPVVSFSPALYLICFHQQMISEADGPRSHFVPSSSEYMRQAILYWGAGTGFILGCDRLLRENNEEWVYAKKKLRCGYLKWNPVPRNGL